MSADFASALSMRLQSHAEFWRDLQYVQTKGIELCIETSFSSGPGSKSDGNENSIIKRLMYCASVFAQSPDEITRGLAQTIALSCLLIRPEPALCERTTDLLAQIGNFPGINYVESHFGHSNSSFLSYLRSTLLRSINSVSIAGRRVALTDFQWNVWHSLQDKLTSSVSAPTSAGKSYVVTEYLCERVDATASITAIYIAPTRALLGEVHKKINARFLERKDVRVSTVPGIDSENRPKQIYVLTQERLYVLLAIANVQADLVVVDEAQNIADGARGMILQDCLEKLRQNRQDSRIIFLSPGADGFDNAAHLLDLGPIEIKQTKLSAVMQNRIRVKALDGDSKSLSLALLNRDGVTELGAIKTSRGMGDPQSRLAAVALELGQKGGALVYATGPVDCEETATQLTADLPKSEEIDLQNLSQFIQDHIHREYGLAEMVLHGVAFHYGRMPTLLREAIETGFKAGHLRYLVCTTTLFQGVNLPARSVFIDTPTRGKGTPLDPAHLWNFAGRAGRLGKDLIGNVFLVDYESWPKQDLHEHVNYKVTPSMSEAIEKNYNAVLQALRGEKVSLEKGSTQQQVDIRAAAGLLLARTSDQRASVLVERLPGISREQKDDLLKIARTTSDKLGFPAKLIESNWTVDLFGLQRLADRMRKKISEGKLEDLIPVHPREGNAYTRYSGIFGRITRDVKGYKSQAIVTYGNFVATYALQWMKGTPYPMILSSWVSHQKKEHPNRSVNAHVRAAFDFIEQTLRFEMVQLGKAYIDVLDMILEETGNHDRRSSVYDFALALELGVSSPSGRAFVELGASRIAAVVLERLIPDSDLTPALAREKLANLNLKAIPLSPVIVSELRELRLLPPISKNSSSS
jgi:hypothetical protein